MGKKKHGVREAPQQREQLREVVELIEDIDRRIYYMTEDFVEEMMDNYNLPEVIISKILAFADYTEVSMRENTLNFLNQRCLMLKDHI